jgi:hypothetical protein
MSITIHLMGQIGFAVQRHQMSVTVTSIISYSLHLNCICLVSRLQLLNLSYGSCVGWPHVFSYLVQYTWLGVSDICVHACGKI